MPFTNASAGSAAGGFHTTRWSVVLSAQQKASSGAAESLEILCRMYWRPLFEYVVRRGNSLHDAQDLTQEFFSRLLAKDWLLAADQERGRFRAFLLMAMKRFLANEWDRTRAQKRGADVAFISMYDTGFADTHATSLATKPANVDAAFDRSWAMTVLDHTLNLLQAEYEAAGRLADYELMKPSLTTDRGEIDYDALAVKLQMEPASARSAVHRLRKRFRQVFREEVAGTVADEAMVEDEMRAVIAALAHE
jgi:DNA-directed RNA polymerase specialized sigma24 family protein